MMFASPRALIVDDDRSWQQILSEILADAGLMVDIADGLEAATKSLRATPHRLAVVDLSLSGDDHQNRDGLRVLDAVRRFDPGCVTLLLTGYATVDLAVSVLTEYGAFTCLRKETFKRAEFRQLIQRVLTSPPVLESASRGPDDALADESPVDTADAIFDKTQSSGLALVVEDDAGWRGILSELLTDAGYQVHACGSYGEALGRLRREQYALAVVDLSLTGLMKPSASDGSLESESDLDGYRLLASTRDSGTPTVVVSGVGTPDDIERAYAERGIFAYLEKQTFDRRAFLETVKEVGAARAAASELDRLTEREREVLGLLAQGMTNKEIAVALVITTNTVKRHLKAIFKKLEVHTRSAAAAKAVGAGIVTESGSLNR